MNCIMNKTRLVEKRPGVKLKKDRKEFKLNNEKHKKQNKKNIKSDEIYKKVQSSITKNKNDKITKNKEYELNKRRKLLREQNESNRTIKQIEGKQKREILVEEYFNSGDIFELATTNKKYVNGLNLHEIESKNLDDYTGDFELIGSMLIGEIEQQQILGVKISMISKLILMP